MKSNSVFANNPRRQTLNNLCKRYFPMHTAEYMSLLNKIKCMSEVQCATVKRNFDIETINITTRMVPTGVINDTRAKDRYQDALAEQLKTLINESASEKYRPNF